MKLARLWVAQDEPPFAVPELVFLGQFFKQSLIYSFISCHCRFLSPNGSFHLMGWATRPGPSSIWNGNLQRHRFLPIPPIPREGQVRPSGHISPVRFVVVLMGWVSRGNAAVTQIPNFLFNYQRARRLSFLTAAQIHQTLSLVLEGHRRRLSGGGSRTTGLWLRANNPRARSAVTLDFFFSPLGLGCFSAVSGARSLRSVSRKWCALLSVCHSRSTFCVI